MELLTLAVARQYLWRQASPLDYDLTNTAELARVDNEINLSSQLFFSLDGNFRGTLERVTLTAYDGRVTLPRGLQTILGVSFGCRHSTVRPIWYEFTIGSTCLHGLSTLNDLGEGFRTFRDIPVPSQIIVNSTESNVSTASLTIQALTATGTVTVLTVALSAAQTIVSSPMVSGILRLSKPVTTHNIQVSYLSGSDHILMADLAPGETDANYRGYRVSASSVTVDAICKRAWIPAVAALDIVVPNNLNALECMMAARKAKLACDDTRYQILKAEAESLADADRQQFDGANQIPIYQPVMALSAASIPKFL